MRAEVGVEAGVQINEDKYMCCSTWLASGGVMFPLKYSAQIGTDCDEQQSDTQL